jgi:hypothetical protein
MLRRAPSKPSYPTAPAPIIKIQRELMIIETKNNNPVTSAPIAETPVDDAARLGDSHISGMRNCDDTAKKLGDGPLILSGKVRNL